MSVSRLDACFKRLRDQQRKALIPFVTAGDPSLEATVPVMHALVEAGADVIELGVPFSDPMADGPTIQRSSERALARGAGSRYVLQAVAQFRERDAQTPVVLMGYLNPVEIHGYAAFAKAAVDAGVDGVLLVDLPPEEAGEAQQAFDASRPCAGPAGIADHQRSTCRQAAGAGPWLSLLRQLCRCHRRVRAPGQRCRQCPPAGVARARVGAGGGGLRHQGCRQCRSHGPPGGRRGGGQRAGGGAGRSGLG